MQGFETKHETLSSNVESHWVVAEIHRDHEALKFAHQTSANWSSHARDEYGDDKGVTLSTSRTQVFESIAQAGIMEEMLEDTLEMNEDEEIEEEADAEVDKVLFELTNGKLGQAGTVGEELPVSPVIHSDMIVC